MSNRKLATILLVVLGAGWLSTCPAQAQRTPGPPLVMTPPAPGARPAEPGVDDVLAQIEQLRQERAAIDAKERAMTELLGRKFAEQGERFRKLGLGAPAADAGKPAAARVAPPRAEPLYFPTRIGTRRVYTAGAVEKVDVVTAVRAEAGGALTVTVTDPALPDSARHVRVSRTALELVPGPDGARGRDVLRPTAADSEQWLPWGEGGLVFRQAGFEQVTVPAGTFRALRVDTGPRSGPGFRAESSVWYAPGVGTVRQVNNGVEVLSLKSFEPGD